MTFKDGGAFDFHTNFEKIKERLQQAVEQVRHAGSDGSQSGNGRDARSLAAVNFASIHLEQLPAYEGPAASAAVTGTTQQNTQDLANIEDHSARSLGNNDGSGGPTASGNPSSSSSGDRFAAPTEPPPGYEEVQQQSVANELENHLRRLQ